MNDAESLGVLIAGAGVAGLEAALALRDLAGDCVRTTLLSPEPEFVYRPMRVREPFASTVARHYSLGEIARDIGADLRQGSLHSLDAERQTIRTAGGEQIAYDALLLATGAQLHQPYEHALTLDDRRLDQQLHGLIEDIEAGYISKLAFLIPTQMAWPLPVYELALMTARRAWDMNEQLSITIATPEDAPLAIFGTEVSRAVAGLLEHHGIATVTSAHCEAVSAREVVIHPGSRSLDVDRIIALPTLRGPAIPGVPSGGEDGFIPVDEHARVLGLPRVFAAGDAVDFPVKHGGISAQQADVAAESIAALAGVSIKPSKFHPTIQGILIGGRRPLYMRAEITGGRGTASEVSDEPIWAPVTKIAAKRLSPYLEARDRAAVR